MKNKKENFWKPGNVIVVRGDVSPEYYIIRGDRLAYPCNKSVDKWWHKLRENDYDDNLCSVLPDNVKNFWDIIEIYESVSELIDITMWNSDNIGETRGCLFFKFDSELAIGLNNDGSFLEKKTYTDDLQCNMKNRKNWDFINVYTLCKSY